MSTKPTKCPTCGADPSANGKGWALTNHCPWCDAQKCTACDMGDDVRCVSCEGEEDDEYDEFDKYEDSDTWEDKEDDSDI